jgi:hypothetical protein
MHDGNCLNDFERTAVSEKRAKSAQYRLILVNETRFFD